MMTKKITKRENYETLKTLVLDACGKDFLEGDEANQLVEFIDHEIAALDKRAASAKKYAAKRKATDDTLTDAVVEVLQNGAMTIPEIVAAVDVEGATPAKVTYRLTKLVEAGAVTKESVSVKEEGKASRKINSYCLVQEADQDE